MRGAAARLWARLGWRGLALLGCGLAWAVYGAGLVTTPRHQVTRGTAVITHLLDLRVWGWAWVACGVAAVVAALLRPGRDAWGFAAASAPPLVWALAWAAAGLVGHHPQAWTVVPLLCVPPLLLVTVAAVTGSQRRVCTCERGSRHGG